MKKEKKLLTLDTETKARLEQYAAERHTSVSQAITDWIWTQIVNTTNTTKNEKE